MAFQETITGLSMFRLVSSCTLSLAVLSISSFSDDPNQAVAALQSLVSAKKLNVAVGVIGNSDSLFFEHAPGDKRSGRSTPVMTDTIVDCASITRLIATVAAL